jgi:rRNA maturation protein Nop10
MCIRDRDEAGRKLFVPAPRPFKPVDENTTYRVKNTNPYARMNMKKGGVIKKKPAAKKPMMKYAKGGSIDGCAIRGKTRAPRTR